MKRRGGIAPLFAAALAAGCGGVSSTPPTDAGSDAPVVACGMLPTVEIAGVVQPTNTSTVSAPTPVQANLSGKVSMIGVGAPPEICSGVVAGSWSWLELDDVASAMSWTLCISIPGFTLPFAAGDAITVVANVTAATFPPLSQTITVKKNGAFVAYFADVHAPPAVSLSDLPSGLSIASGSPICHEPDFGDCNVTSFGMSVSDGSASAMVDPGQNANVGSYAVTVGRNDQYVDTMGTCQAGTSRFTFTVTPH